MISPSDSSSSLGLVLELIRRARAERGNLTALRFVAVNDTHLLAPYQQAALLEHGRVAALSGLVQIEANAPYVRWLEKLTAEGLGASVRTLQCADLPSALAEEWNLWFPPHALWIPGSSLGSGLILARDSQWTDYEQRLLTEWFSTWAALHDSTQHRGLLDRARASLQRRSIGGSRAAILIGFLLVAVGLFPVRLSVLAPGEIAPLNPVAIRAPIDGIIEAFHVQSNERVASQQVLFTYDQALWTARLESALEALRSVEAEERQYSLQALTDARARSQLAVSRSMVEERRLEVKFLQAQLSRASVAAPQGGIVLMDDASEWVGRPVAAGQRILRLVEPDNKQVEIWLPAGDAIILPERAEVRLYLQSSPLKPLTATIRRVALEATRRPEGHYAYRVEATLSDPTLHRVGLKGTARLHGNRVPLIYWVLRRPLAALREFCGI